MSYIQIILDFTGSFGLFIFGMHILAAGLQKSAGGKMKRILETLTRNRYTAVLLGAGVTAIIQSSSATTVMVVGFVNAGIMQLSQAIGVIMGANIGTTVTGWIVSSIEWSKYIKPSTIAPIATATGAVMMLFSKKKNAKQAGEIIVGIGVLFMGMSAMPDALKPLSEMESVRNLFVTLGTNPLFGVLTGMLVTGIIQSSSVSVGILQSLALTGVIPWNAAVYIIMGQNIGTCVTALLSSIGTSRSAKSAAYMHLMFNIAGSLIFSVLSAVFFTYINPSFGKGPITITEISIVHTSFNVATTLLLLPFSDYLIKLAVRMAKTGKIEVSDDEIVHLDDRVLNSPPFAIQNSMMEIQRLAKMAFDNLTLATSAVFDRKPETADKVFKREDSIDKLEEAITTYLVKICNESISETENMVVTSLFHTLNDIERIGDHAENIAELAEYAREEETTFSSSAVAELNELIDRTCSCFGFAVSALESGDEDCAAKVLIEEDIIDGLKIKFRNNHITRLANNECNVRSGVVFLEMLTNLERVSDHAKNIAQGVTARAAHINHQQLWN